MSSCAICELSGWNSSARPASTFISYKHLDPTTLPTSLVSWISKNKQNSENEMKTLHNFMSSCAICNLFGRNSSPQSLLIFIPNKFHEQTAPSWSAGRLNAQNKQNQQKGNEKPEYLHEFLSDSESVLMEFKRSIPSIIHPIQASWTDRSFLKRWPVEILKISKIGEIQRKTWISPWALVQVGICLDKIQALECFQNSSHTSILNRPLLPESLVGWSSWNQQKKRKWNEKPQRRLEFSTKLNGFWFPQ